MTDSSLIFQGKNLNLWCLQISGHACISSFDTKEAISYNDLGNGIGVFPESVTLSGQQVVTTNGVPEPAMLSLLAVSLAGFGFGFGLARHKKR